MDDTFGEALQSLKRGKRIRRIGWPKGKWLVLVEGWTVDVKHETVLHGCLPVPWIGLKTDRMDFMPWVPTHDDLLSCTWGVAYDNDL